MIELIEKIREVTSRFKRVVTLKQLKLLSTFMPSISLIMALFLYYYSTSGSIFSVLCSAGAILSGIVFLVSFLTYLTLLDLESIFSESIYDGAPTKPSLHSVLHQLSDFLSDYGEILKRVLPWIFPWVKSYAVNYNFAGRVFTYISMSTLVYWVFVVFIYFILPGELSKNWETVFTTIFFLFLTIIFFAVKERVFKYFSCKLVFSEKERLNKEKRILIDRANQGLAAFASGNIVHTSTLNEKIQLMEKKVAHIDEKIEKTEEKYEFHISLKMIVVSSSILVLGSLWLLM